MVLRYRSWVGALVLVMVLASGQPIDAKPDGGTPGKPVLPRWFPSSAVVDIASSRDREEIFLTWAYAPDFGGMPGLKVSLVFADIPHSRIGRANVANGLLSWDTPTVPLACRYLDVPLDDACEIWSAGFFTSCLNRLAAPWTLQIQMDSVPIPTYVASGILQVARTALRHGDEIKNNSSYIRVLAGICTGVCAACFLDGKLNPLRPNCGHFVRNVHPLDQLCRRCPLALPSKYSGWTLFSEQPIALCADNVAVPGRTNSSGCIELGESDSACTRKGPSPVTCTPDATQCHGSSVQVCDKRGERWVSTLSCAACCRNGACGAPICQPGDERCDMNTVQVCQIDGCGWVATEQCVCCDAGSCGRVFYLDLDQDDHGDPSFPGRCLSQPAGPYTASINDDCDDGDRDRYPGHVEWWDVRDNNCNGAVDEAGLLRLDRWHREWGPEDWEHRFDAGQLAGFVKENHFVELYPVPVCSTPQYSAPGCRLIDSGQSVEVRPGIELVALGECSGRFGVTGSGSHITLYLPEDSSEHAYYAENQQGVNPFISCRRVGYVLAVSSAARAAFPGSREFFRLRSGFQPSFQHDNMWSTLPSEPDHPTYMPFFADDSPHWYAPAGF